MKSGSNLPLVFGTFASVWLAGCAELHYPKISGETYYLWLSESVTPVVQRREYQGGKQGLRVYAHAAKSELRGFVAFEDVARTKRAQSRLFDHARAYQQAFTQGCSHGLTVGLDASSASMTALPDAPVVPSQLQKSADYWRAGWKHGYHYGYRELSGRGFGCTLVSSDGEHSSP